MPRVSRRRWLSVILGVTFLVFSIVAIRSFKMPVIWISLAATALLIWAAIVSSSVRSRMAWLYLAMAIFGIGAAEGWLRWERPDILVSYGQYILKRHPFLGYAGTPNAQRVLHKTIDGEVIYNATCTLNSHGFRIAPPHDPERDLGTLVFFGGSQTFGEGLSDEQAMPYLTGLAAEGRYRIFHLGFHGWGAHQMLSALEHGLVENVVEGTPKVGVYTLIPTHALRVSGLAYWDGRGPGYRRTADDAVTYAGPFDKNPDIQRARTLRSYLRKSVLIERFLGVDGIEALRQEHVDLLIAIIGKARRLFESRYPGSRFHVIFWNDDDSLQSKKIEKALHGLSIPVHRISDILPDYETAAAQYRVHRHDGHASAHANEIIARYVLEKIVGE